MRERFAVHVNDQQVIRLKTSLAQPGRRDQHPVVIQAGGDVAVIGGHQPADIADLSAFDDRQAEDGLKGIGEKIKMIHIRNLSIEQFPI